MLADRQAQAQGLHGALTCLLGERAFGGIKRRQDRCPIEDRQSQARVSDLAADILFPRINLDMNLTVLLLAQSLDRVG